MIDQTYYPMLDKRVSCSFLLDGYGPRTVIGRVKSITHEKGTTFVIVDKQGGSISSRWDSVALGRDYPIDVRNITSLTECSETPT